MTSLTTFQERLSSPLPGALAHNLMKPMPPLPMVDCPQREAAVLVLLSPLGIRFPRCLDDLVVTLIRRTESSHHSHELGFPGGLRESGEPLPTTALREAEEEIGLDPTRVEILGSLSEVLTVTSATNIFPVLGLTRTFPELQSNAEVQSIIHVPLSTLASDDARGMKVVRHPELGRRRVPYFLIGSEELWGASAKIMAELLALVCGRRFLG